MNSREEFMKELNERDRLKRIIKKLIREAMPDPTAPSPHPHTGINVLEDLLKKIIPVIQADFKILTTSPNQRMSFRAHLLNGIQNSLVSLRALDKIDENKNSGKTSWVLTEEINVDLEGDEDDMFIDIEDQPEPSDKEKFANGVSDDAKQDYTGRNMAFTTYKKIEKSILDAYELLSDPQDQELFYTYLITNIKLYLDKFEDQLAGELQEPSTQEYEDAKASI
tara:strand:+ start:551 stop:1219 length:669 start_codon:yes stop_codon:yes gene_type:complete